MAALELIASKRFHLLVVDLRLPGMSGIEMMRRLREQDCAVPFVLVSGFADVPTTVEAMKLGAYTVLEKPIDIDQLCSVARSAVSRPPGGSGTEPLHEQPAVGGTHVDDRGSAAKRVAFYIVRMCESEADLKTVTDWGRFIGVSSWSLAETCRVALVKPHDARDFARMLRCFVRATIDRCPPQVLLDVSDRRTLEALLERSGLTAGCAEVPSAGQYLLSQQFIPPDHAALRIVRELLSSGQAQDEHRNRAASSVPITTDLKRG